MTELKRNEFGIAQVGTVMRAPKTAELIATNLRRQIVRGELRPGETLPPEVHLMEQFGVSRPTLREAFRILEAESLIGVRRGSRGGAQVLAPDPRVAARHVGLLLQLQGTSIQDVYEARMVTEPYCARLLAKNRTAQDVTDLRAYVDQMRDVLDSQGNTITDPNEWSRMTYRFHEMMMQRCGNKTLAVQGAVLADIVATHLQQAVSASIGEEAVGGRFQKTIRSYSKLVDLVEAKDTDGAEKHWRRHMEVAAQFVFRNDPKDKSIVDLFG